MPIYTGSGSALSTTASTDHLIYMDDVLVQSQNTSNANYSVMKEWTVSTSGPFKLKFVARNRPGTYYYSYIVYNATKGTRINPAGSGNDSNNCRWNDNLDSGETSSVHGMRRFSLTCGSDINSVTAGDVIQLMMVHTDGSGNPATGTGQTIDCNMLRVYSSSPLLYGGDPVIARTSQVHFDVGIHNTNTSGFAQIDQGESIIPWGTVFFDNGGGPNGAVKVNNSTTSFDYKHVVTVPGFYENHISLNHRGKVELGMKKNGSYILRADQEDVGNGNWSHSSMHGVFECEVGDVLECYRNLQTSGGTGWDGTIWDRWMCKLVYPTYKEYQDQNWVSSNGGYFNQNAP